jgi:hypothetical protein
MMDSPTSKTYSKLEGKRASYLARARTCSTLTIPSLFPEEGHDEEDFIVPYQGTGAKGVKSLASKILLALFPPNTPFFMMTVDEAELGEAIPDKTKGDLEKSLRVVEKMVSSKLEQMTMRVVIFEALKQLLVGGNVLLHIGKDKVRAIRLDNYVVRRDGNGMVKTTIIKESIDKSDLPDEVLDVQGADKEKDANEDQVFMFTVIQRQPNGRFKVHQEVNGVKLEGSEGNYKADSVPYIPLRMIAVDGEHYGRSYVEEHLGDLNACENLSKAIIEGALAFSRLIFLVKPNAQLKLSELNKARNGDYLQGNPDDVTALQVDKNADFQIANMRLLELERSLAEAFMMTQSVQRQAERVTAEEIRALTSELEATLGGVYSLLAQELQMPMIQLTVSRLEKEGKLQKLPKGVKPKVLTGIEAMGRSSELQKLSSFLNFLQPLGKEAIAEYLEVDEYLKRLANATNLETEGLITTKEQREAKQKAQQQQQMTEKVAPQVMQKGQ